MTLPRRTEDPAHPSHDPLLIAASLVGDLGPEDAREARALLAGCRLCASLADDLRAIASATRDLRDAREPAPAGRSFLLDRRTADALARGRWWRALLRPFGRGAAVRPAAGALAAFGLAGFLLASIPAPTLGPGLMERDLSGASSPTIARGSDAAGGGVPVDMAVTPGPKEWSSGGSATPAVTYGTDQPSGGGSGGGGARSSYLPLAQRLQERSPLIALSGALLALAVGLLALRRAARRLT